MELIHSNDGTPVAFWRSGAGPALLLVHGAAADHTRWTPVLAAFEQRFTVHALDRRGRGGSGDAAHYAIEREFEDVAAMLASIDGPVNVVGHSYGAICALEAALLAQNVGRLVLYEPPVSVGIPLHPPGSIDAIQALVDRGERDAALTMFLRDAVKMPPHELEVLRQSPVWPARVAAAHTLPREMRIDPQYRFDPRKFSGFDTPTLLLLGADSPPIFSKATETVAAALPNSRVVTLSGQQHMAINTAPDLFVRDVLRFLTE